MLGKDALAFVVAEVGDQQSFAQAQGLLDRLHQAPPDAALDHQAVDHGLDAVFAALVEGLDFVEE